MPFPAGHPATTANFKSASVKNTLSPLRSPGKFHASRRSASEPALAASGGR